MIEIFGPKVSQFVVNVLAAPDYERLEYTHQEAVSMGELSSETCRPAKVSIEQPSVADFAIYGVFGTSLSPRRFLLLRTYCRRSLRVGSCSLRLALQYPILTNIKLHVSCLVKKHAIFTCHHF